MDNLLRLYTPLDHANVEMYNLYWTLNDWDDKHIIKCSSEEERKRWIKVFTSNFMSITALPGPAAGRIIYQPRPDKWSREEGILSGFYFFTKNPALNKRLVREF